MKTYIHEQLARIWRAVNDGTLDKDTVNDALKNISEATDKTPMPVLERAKEALKPNLPKRKRKVA